MTNLILKLVNKVKIKMIAKKLLHEDTFKTLPRNLREILINPDNLQELNYILPNDKRLHDLSRLYTIDLRKIRRPQTEEQVNDPTLNTRFIRKLIVDIIDYDDIEHKYYYDWIAGDKSYGVKYMAKCYQVGNYYCTNQQKISPDLYDENSQFLTASELLSLEKVINNDDTVEINKNSVSL